MQLIEQAIKGSKKAALFFPLGCVKTRPPINLHVIGIN
jgi:hypothetical protein